jgi:hypothetical protein
MLLRLNLALQPLSKQTRSSTPHVHGTSPSRLRSDLGPKGTRTPACHTIVLRVGCRGRRDRVLLAPVAASPLRCRSGSATTAHDLSEFSVSVGRQRSAANAHANHEPVTYHDATTSSHCSSATRIASAKVMSAATRFTPAATAAARCPPHRRSRSRRGVPVATAIRRSFRRRRDPVPRQRAMPSPSYETDVNTLKTA